MRTSLRATLLIAGAGVVAAVALTAAGAGAASPSSGTITGTAQPCVGPVGVNSHHTVPSVSVLQGKHVVAETKNLSSPYTFSFTVHTGTYSVAAPGDGTVQAQVAKGKTVTVTLRSGCL